MLILFLPFSPIHLDEHGVMVCAGSDARAASAFRVTTHSDSTSKGAAVVNQNDSNCLARFPGNHFCHPFLGFFPPNNFNEK